MIEGDFMKSLVLAEKPSVAREIARVLGCKQQHKHYIEGNKYIVTWALGHLVELKMPEHYDKRYATWNLEDLPIIPKEMGLKTIQKTNQQFRGIQAVAKRKDITDCIIATDAGREGELVARWILEKIRWQKPVKRLWISSQTDKAIKDGFKNLKPGKQYDSLYDSAVCRAEADWLIGLNVTRALTMKYNEPLSAGRVQTPSLAMIIDREKRIQSFTPKEYWVISATVNGLQIEWEHQGDKRIFNKEKADAITKKLHGQSAILQSIERKKKREIQPLPYDLTELQRDANRRFDFSAKKTANVLQRLYEQHKLVTYPRTDSRYLTSDMKGTMGERLNGIHSGYTDEIQAILKSNGRVMATRVFNNAKVTDHHAIIPTEELLKLQHLDQEERKLYDLIVRRFLALFYPPYQFETIEATFKINGETFIAKTTHVLESGFRKVTGHSEQTGPSFTNMNVGKQYQVGNIELSSKFTEAPPRFSEADLLSNMEKFNLGTPATRADIIERLLHTEAIERQNGRLHPTQKGKQLIELVNEQLKSAKMTAKWEEKLEQIARGKDNPAAFMNDIRSLTKQLVSEIKKSEKTYRAHNITGSKCPECDAFLKERNTKNGRILVCSNMDCRYQRRKDPILSKRRCPQCRKRMEMHKGKAGLYFQCRQCNVVEKAEQRKKTVSKREERKLVQKYSKAEDSFGTNLGDLLKQALEKKE